MKTDRDELLHDALLFLESADWHLGVNRRRTPWDEGLRTLIEALREADKVAQDREELPCYFVWQARREGRIKAPCDEVGTEDYESMPEHAYCPACKMRTT